MKTTPLKLKSQLESWIDGFENVDYKASQSTVQEKRQLKALGIDL